MTKLVAIKAPLHRRAKARAARLDMKLQELVEQAIEGFLRAKPKGQPSHAGHDLSGPAVASR